VEILVSKLMAFFHATFGRNRMLSFYQSPYQLEYNWVLIFAFLFIKSKVPYGDFRIWNFIEWFTDLPI